MKQPRQARQRCQQKSEEGARRNFREAGGCLKKRECGMGGGGFHAAGTLAGFGGRANHSLIRSRVSL